MCQTRQHLEMQDGCLVFCACSIRLSQLGPDSDEISCYCLCVCRFPSVEESLSIGRTHPLIIIAVRYYTSWFSLCERERDLARPLKEGQEEFTSLKLFTNRRGEDEKSGSGSKAEENTHITTLRPSDGKRPAGQQTHWRLVGPYFTPSSIGENKIWNSKGKKNRFFFS